MGIFLRCPKCKSDHKLGTEECGKCGHSLKSDRKFKVAIKLIDGRRAVRIVDTLTLAKRMESSLKGKVAERKHLGVIQSPYLLEIWIKYLDWARKNKKSWRDDKYRWDKHVSDFVQDRRMNALYPKDIEAILNKMEKSPGKEHAAATRKHVFVLIKRVYNWAIQLGHYNGPNPAANLKPPKVKNLKTECLTREQLGDLLVTLNHWKNQRAALIVKFALYTGLRQNEILGLKWGDLDLEKGFVTLHDPKGLPTTLPIAEEAKSILAQAETLKPSDSCNVVFPNKHGQRRVSFYKIWSRIRDAAGLPADFRFHGLRHTFASYLASSGEVDLYQLQKLLNHQSSAMTQRYAHLLDEALRRGANVADKVFGPSKDDP